SIAMFNAAVVARSVPLTVAVTMQMGITGLLYFFAARIGAKYVALLPELLQTRVRSIIRWLVLGLGAYALWATQWQDQQNNRYTLIEWVGVLTCGIMLTTAVTMTMRQRRDTSRTHKPTE